MVALLPNDHKYNTFDPPFGTKASGTKTHAPNPITGGDFSMANSNMEKSILWQFGPNWQG
jgi:hypothetical protein